MSFLDDFDPLGGAPAPAPKKSKKVAKPAPVDDSDEEEEPQPKPVKKKAAKKVVAPPPEEEEEEEEPAPVPVKKKAVKKVVQPPPEPEEEDEEPAPPPPKKKAAAAAAPPAKAPVKKKKKVVSSSDSSSSSSSSDSSDEEGRPPKKKIVRKAAGAGASSAPAAKPGVKKQPSVSVPQTQLFDFGDMNAPAAAAPGEPDSDDAVEAEEQSEPDSPVAPPPKKKAAAKKPAAAAQPEPAVAAPRTCSVADCGAPRVKRGYCAVHANDPSAPVGAATSMAAFLGDESEEALEGFNDLEVSRPPKKKAGQARRDVGLDGDDANNGYQEENGDGDYYDPNAAGGDGYETRSPPSASLPGAGSSVGGRKKSPKDWRIDFENTSTSLGLNKNIITWTFIWKRQLHTVELHHSTFGGKRKILVDDRVRVSEKKPFADASRYDMRIGEGPLSVNIGVQLKAAGLTAFTYELYIEKQPYDQAQKYWLTHQEV